MIIFIEKEVLLMILNIKTLAHQKIFSIIFRKMRIYVAKHRKQYQHAFHFK